MAMLAMGGESMIPTSIPMIEVPDPEWDEWTPRCVVDEPDGPYEPRSGGTIWTSLPPHLQKLVEDLEREDDEESSFPWDVAFGPWALGVIMTEVKSKLEALYLRSLEAPLPKPVSLGYSSGLPGGAPKQPRREEEGAAASPERGKRAKAGEPRLQGGYKVGDEVYCNVDETDPRFAFEFKGKVEAVVEEGYEVHFDGIDVTDVFSVDEVRPRPATPCPMPPPHPPRTPPAQ